MKSVEIDLSYASVEEAIKTLQEYAGQNAILCLGMEPVPYEDRDCIKVVVEIPETKGEATKTTLSKTLVGYTYDHLRPSDRFWFDENPGEDYESLWFDYHDIIDCPMPELKMTTKITITVEIEIPETKGAS